MNKNKQKKLEREISDIYGCEDNFSKHKADDQSNLSSAKLNIDFQSVDLFERNQAGVWNTGVRVARMIALSHKYADIVSFDAWKKNAGGVFQGMFLLAYDDSAIDNSDLHAILLRVIGPTDLPQTIENKMGMIDCYKENLKTSNNEDSHLDFYTRCNYSMSGLRCSILGSFYKNKDQKIQLGSDLGNHYSPNNYTIIKPSPEILDLIVNYGLGNSNNKIKIGKVRYSSSQQLTSAESITPIYIQAQDILGKRTALFGMTRTGKSNTMKKIVQATFEMSNSAQSILDLDPELKQFDENGIPIYPVGQIIFDINGEYANNNLQDGTSIFDMFKKVTERYSTIKKDGCKQLKVNFYNEIEAGFNIIKEHTPIANDKARFVANFRNVSLVKPDDYDSNRSAATRYDRRVAVYLCCLYKAGFDVPPNFKVFFCANENVRTAVDPNIIHENGYITLDLNNASVWWERLWSIYNTAGIFKNYEKYKSQDEGEAQAEGVEWADDELKALLTILTRKREPGATSTDCAGFRILKDVIPYHTDAIQDPFEDDILKSLRTGRIVVVDLSLESSEAIQRMYSERITRKIFIDANKRFTENRPNNFIQFYFEEAHNIFPKKEDGDLSQIYNRLAKEGAKFQIGMIYATQEVTSISGNILKNTQNWFIAHLNNQDEIKEIAKYHDFSDCVENLIKFSQDTDKGFVRMKTYSSTFVVPVQIDIFKKTG